MVIISPAVDDADPVAAANGARAPRLAPAANNLDPAAADVLSLLDVVHGTTATADVVGAGTTPWWGWSCSPPYYAGSDAYASSSFLPPPPQSHGDDLACYAGSIMDTSSFPPPPPPPPVYMRQPELSYLYYQQPQFAPVLEPAGMPIRPVQLQVPTTQPASMPPPSYYPQTTQAATTGSASVADKQQAQQDDTRPTPRRRGRPSKRALAMSSEPPLASKPTKRVAVASNRAASSSSSQKTTMSPSAAGQVQDQAAGGSRSSSGSTSDQQTAACTSTNRPVALLCDERCQLLQRPDLSNGAAAGVVVEGEDLHHQQAAIAPPGPQYADTSAVGVRFQPKDEQLIDYLRMKYAGQQMPVKFIKDFDVYQAHPMAIKGACGESQNGCWYAFSRRDRKYKNGKRPARSVFVEGGRKQVGFWKSNSRLGDVRAGGKKDGAVIGRVTSLTFQLGRQPKGKQTGWKMREYTIPENQHQPDGSALLLNDWVVCQLFYKEQPGGTNPESKTDGSATSVGVGPERPPYMHGKSENVISVGQKRPRRTRKSSKKDTIAIPVAVGLEEDGLGEAAGESVQGEEDMQPQMVPAAHQASDYSEQDLCVEDYLVCDVAFAEQNDAANCTI